MKTKLIRLSLLSALIAFSVCVRAQDFSAEDLARRAIHRRAVEAVIWGMSAVNCDLMYQAMVREAKGAFNKIVYWSRLPDWKNQTLTPNPDAIYFMPFINTKDVGPVVLEIPPADEGSITGTVMDVWQSALEDVGPAGVDKGQGGKYLILPPGYKDQVPAGYIPLASETYEGYALLRSVPKSAARRMLPRRLPTASGSSSIRSHKRPIRPRRRSSTPSTSCMTALSPTTCGSSSRSTASCGRNHGWNGTRR
jgi:hypothetical protein